MSGSNNYKTIRVRWEEDLCFLQLYRPDDKNTINDTLVKECAQVIEECEIRAKIVVLEGLDEVFCFGADFASIAQADSTTPSSSPEPMYNLWLQLVRGSFVSLAHVRGQANAGRIGFVAACDLVLADQTALFSLSELLFGLMPACVLPFLIRKVGFQKAHALTLLTKPVGVKEAMEWGLVDACEENSSTLVRKYLLRLRRLNKTSITRYKRYMNSLDTGLEDSKEKALAANLEVFSDRENLSKISRYVKTGEFPWE